MGSQSKYDAKRWVYIDVNIPKADDKGTPGEAVKYGFPTNVPGTTSSALGHKDITDLADPPDKLVVGCSFPKPRRASKTVRGSGGRCYSSFVSEAKVIAVKNDGWRVTKTKAVANIKLASDSQSLVQTVYVTIRGIKYAWNQPKVTETNLTEGKTSLSAIGVKKAAAGDRDELCFGANFPKPPRASFIVTGKDKEKDGPKIISTFYDPSGTLPTGWNTVLPGTYAL